MIIIFTKLKGFPEPGEESTNGSSRFDKTHVFVYNYQNLWSSFDGALFSYSTTREKYCAGSL